MSDRVNDILSFGRYEGLWRDSLTDTELEIVIDENNFESYKRDKYGQFAFDGYFELRIIAGSQYADYIGQQLMEKVRGLYFNFLSICLLTIYVNFPYPRLEVSS